MCITVYCTIYIVNILLHGKYLFRNNSLSRGYLTETFVLGLITERDWYPAETQLFTLRFSPTVSATPPKSGCVVNRKKKIFTVVV